MLGKQVNHLHPQALTQLREGLGEGGVPSQGQDSWFDREDDSMDYGVSQPPPPQPRARSPKRARSWVDDEYMGVS